MASQRLVRCFLNCDMRCQHDGLAAIASREDVDVYDLPAGQHVVFVNRKLNRVKMFSPGGVLSYLRLNNGERLSLDTLKYIPQAYGAGGMDVVYSIALRRTLREEAGIIDGQTS